MSLKTYHYKKLLTIVYGLIGLFVSYESIIRLWQEGSFGNNPTRLFLFLIGPQIGFLTLTSALCLTIGQGFKLLNIKSAIWFSRISFLFAIMTLITTYFFYGDSYIWSNTIDFFIFTSFITILYLPVITREQFLNKLKHKNSISI